MAVEVVMPKWGLSMQEGLIGQWLKQEGEPVEQGEEIVEIETEKITNVVEAPASGILAKIVHPAGVHVPVTQLIAIITAPGEAVPEITAPSTPAPAAASEAVAETPVPSPATPAPTGKIRAMPVARKLAQEHGLDLAQIEGSGRGGAITKEDVERALAAQPKPVSAESIRAMPVARRMAKEHGLDLTTIQGSGRNGTITKEDVERALSTKKVPEVRALRRVTFYSDGHRLDGLLYSPANLSPEVKQPGLVLCVGYTYLKTMVMPDIAKVLNKLGYVCLTFDYRGFGDSDGPRHRLIPQEQISDIRAALTFMADQPHVDPERLGVIGISLGGAHAITVGAIDQRVKTVVALEPMGNGGRWLRSLRRHTEWLDFEQRLKADRLQRMRTGQSERVDPHEIVMPDPGSKAFLDAVAQEFPQMQCELPLETAEALLEYSPESVIDQLDPTPLLIVHGEQDRLIPLDESIMLIELAGANTHLTVLPEMDHFNWVMPNSPGFTEVTDQIVQFLETYFPAAS